MKENPNIWTQKKKPKKPELYKPLDWETTASHPYPIINLGLRHSNNLEREREEIIKEIKKLTEPALGPIVGHTPIVGRS